jgi:threonine synthase
MTNQPVKSSLTHLECPECSQQFDAGSLQTICQDCNAPLLARYDLAGLQKSLDPQAVKNRPRGLWRWAEWLPVRDSSHRVTLGEGDTPLIPALRLAKSLGLETLYVKDESTNPTGTFKARGISVAVSKAVELGVDTFVIPTAGNAGGALATYCARANCRAHVFMPEDAPRVNLLEVEHTGTDLHLVQGSISDAAQAATQAGQPYTETDTPWFNISTFKEPYRLEGKKTMGFELAEALNWELPDVVVYPTGGGTGLVGIWKAFNELKAIGWVDEIPTRMVSVQASGCAPIVRAFQDGASRAEPWQDPHTLAAGLRVPSVFADRLILGALKESAGTALSVTDEEILAAQKQLAEMEGIFPAPEGAATLAGLKKLIAAGWVKPQEKIVLLNTGSGLKYI